MTLACLLILGGCVTGTQDNPAQLQRDSASPAVAKVRYLDSRETPAKANKKLLVPGYARLRRIEISDDPSAGTGLALFRLDAPVPLNLKDQMTLEIYLEGSDGRVNHALVVALGNTALATSPPIRPGEGGVVDLHTGRVLVRGKISTEASVVRMQIPQPLPSGCRPYLAISRYLPAHIDPATVAGGLDACWVDILERPEARASSLLVPHLPRADGGDGA